MGTMVANNRRVRCSWGVAVAVLLAAGACKKQPPSTEQATPEASGEPTPLPVADTAAPPPAEPDVPTAPASDVTAVPDAAPAAPAPLPALSLGIISKPRIENGRFVFPTLYAAGDDVPQAEGAAANAGGRLAPGDRALYTVEFNPDGSARELLGDAYGGGNYVIEGGTVTFTRFEVIPGAPRESRKFTTSDEFQTLVEEGNGTYRHVRRLVTPFAFQGPAGEVLACLDFGSFGYWKTGSGQEAGPCRAEASGDGFSLHFDGPTPRTWTVGADGKTLTDEGGSFSLLETVPPELTVPPTS